jgi:hypothetical protein
MNRSSLGSHATQRKESGMNVVLGAGLIFVRRDSVRGLSTAASIWVSELASALTELDLVDAAVATDHRAADD